MPATRRERLRTATISEIKHAALDQLADRGAGALSRMRGIARAIGMSPAGLYRYYDGLEALITDLITDAYNDLADHVMAASSEGQTRDRFRNAMLAYREWCLEHRNRFLLIFGTPIPGYTAPEDGPTTAANQRIGEAFFTIGADAWQRAELSEPKEVRAVEPTEVEFAQTVAPGFPAEVVGAFLSIWAHFHGMVTLEILNQLHWMYPDPGRFYRREIERLLEGFIGSG